MRKAAKFHVLPIDDRVLERTNAALVGLSRDGNPKLGWS
jgi:hypothetical protein